MTTIYQASRFETVSVANPTVLFQTAAIIAICFTKVVPVTCLYAGELDMLERVQEAIMVHQTNKTAIAFGMAFAQLLETIIMGGSLKL